MMYAEKGLALFSLMNDMSDSLINESDIGGVVAVKPKRERASRFSAFMNHPAMVAVLCAVVALGVMAAIVMAGRGSWDVPPGINPTGSEQIEEETDILSEQIEEETDILDVYGHIFCVGRTLDEIKEDAHALGMNTSTHLGYTYVAVNESAFLLVRSDETGYVFAVRSYQHKTPTRADYASLKPGMELCIQH